jgi:hypothetical protein
MDPFVLQSRYPFALAPNSARVAGDNVCVCLTNSLGKLQLTLRLPSRGSWRRPFCQYRMRNSPACGQLGADYIQNINDYAVDEVIRAYLIKCVVNNKLSLTIDGRVKLIDSFPTNMGQKFEICLIVIEGLLAF